MKLQQFSGGLNIKDAPHLVKINEAVKYENIDNESGELKPCKALTKLGSTFTENDKFIEHLDTVTPLIKTPLDFIEYQDKIYYSVEDDFIQMKDVLGSPTTEGDLGLDQVEIIDLELSTQTIPRPIETDINILENIIPGSQVANLLSRGYFIKGRTYNFAFIRIGEGENLSNVFYFDYVYQGNPFGHIQIQLPYKHHMHMRVGGIWRRLLFNWASHFYNISGVHRDFGSRLGLSAFQGGVERYEVFHSDFVKVQLYGSTLIDLIIGVTSGLNQGIKFSKEVDLAPLTEGETLAVAGTYSYVATVSIFHLGWESEPSNLITAIITDSQLPEISVALSIIDDDGLPVEDDRVDVLSIYRIGNTITDFTLLKTFDDPNAIGWPITFIDREPDTNIAGGKILDSEDHDKPLPGLKNLNVINGQLISLLNTRLYFSPIGKLFALPPVNFREFRETLIGTFNIDAGLVICSVKKTWLLNTSNIATGKILQLSEEFGCTSQKTMTGWRTGAIWSSEFGLCASFGGKVELIAKGFLGYTNLNITHAKMYNETYFGFTSQGTVIALDLRYGRSIKKFNFLDLIDIDATTILRQIYIQNQALKVLFGATVAIDSYTIFGSTKNETFIWKSPDFIEGAYTDLKTYKDIYVYATKGINFKTFINDVLVDETDFTTEDSHHIKVEHDKHQGYRISFEATGKGTIREIEYKAMGSQDGR